jgi:hypothetical protein
MGDAGPWIPALALRAVLRPHDNPFSRDELEAWRRTVRPGWRFTGERRVYEVRLDAEATRRQPERYREVFRAGRAAVFQIVGP